MFHFKTNFQRPVRRRHSSDRRGGVAAVEAAFCIPVLVILMFGTLEICAGIYLRESITVAAFEGVRAGIGRGTDADDIRDAVNQVLADRDISLGDTGRIVIQPANFNNINALDPVSVEISVPTTDNVMFAFSHMVNRTVRARAVMYREFDENPRAN